MKMRGEDMAEDEDAMRPEYDFSEGVRGITAQRYAQGTNVVVISPEVLEVFPDGAAVNEALRALAPVLRRSRAAARLPLDRHSGAAELEHKERDAAAETEIRQRKDAAEVREELLAEQKRLDERAAAVRNSEARVRDSVEVLDACINGGLEPDPTREALFAVAEGHPLDEAAESALQRERARKRRVAEKNDLPAAKRDRNRH